MGDKFSKPSPDQIPTPIPVKSTADTLTWLRTQESYQNATTGGPPPALVPKKLERVK
jgi:hypothetical protein